MTKVNKFDHDVFGKLDVIVYEDKLYFVASKVAKILGYSRPNNAIQTHCKSMILINTPIQGIEIPARGLNIIPEKDVYRLVMRSGLERAEEFQDWVMEEVLPTIRKTGGFVSDVDQIFYKNESDENGGQEGLRSFIKQQQECMLEIQEEFQATLQLALQKKDERKQRLLKEETC